MHHLAFSYSQAHNIAFFHNVIHGNILCTIRMLGANHIDLKNNLAIPWKWHTRLHQNGHNLDHMFDLFTLNPKLKLNIHLFDILGTWANLRILDENIGIWWMSETMELVNFLLNILFMFIPRFNWAIIIVGFQQLVCLQEAFPKLMLNWLIIKLLQHLVCISCKKIAYKLFFKEFIYILLNATWFYIHFPKKGGCIFIGLGGIRQTCFTWVWSLHQGIEPISSHPSQQVQIQSCFSIHSMSY